MDTFFGVIRRNLLGDLEYVKIVEQKSERKAALHVSKLFLTGLCLGRLAFHEFNKSAFSVGLVAGTFGVISIISNKWFEIFAVDIPRENKFKNRIKAVFVTVASTLITATIMTIFRENMIVMDIVLIYFPTITVLSCVEVIASKIRSRGIFYKAIKNE